MIVYPDPSAFLTTNAGSQEKAVMECPFEVGVYGEFVCSRLHTIYKVHKINVRVARWRIPMLPTTIIPVFLTSSI